MSARRPLCGTSKAGRPACPAEKFRETYEMRLGLPLVVERAWGAEVTHV